MMNEFYRSVLELFLGEFFSGNLPHPPQQQFLHLVKTAFLFYVFQKGNIQVSFLSNESALLLYFFLFFFFRVN